MYGLLETLPHCGTSTHAITLGDYTYIVDGRVVKGPLVRQGHIFSSRENCEAKGDEEEGERTCPTCIQYQFYRGYIIPVHAWGAIRYGYKSPLIFI